MIRFQKLSLNSVILGIFLTKILLVAATLGVIWKTVCTSGRVSSLLCLTLILTDDVENRASLPYWFGQLQ